MYGRRAAAGAFTREGAPTPVLSRVVVDNLSIVAEIFGSPIQLRGVGGRLDGHAAAYALLCCTAPARFGMTVLMTSHASGNMTRR